MGNILETRITRIDALTRQPAPTIFHLGKIQYTFCPRPELTGDTETSVCIVISQEHRDHLLNDPMCREYYREYVPRVKVAGAEEALERAMFEEWKKLRETLTPEEIMAIMTPKAPAADLPTREPMKEPEVTTAVAAGVQSTGSVSTALAGNTTTAKKAKPEAPAEASNDLGKIF